MMGLRRAGALFVLPLIVAVTGCGGGGASGGTITADGSSTVGPYVTAAAEDFQRENSDVRITVGISGTGGGFERFCREETDISNASRPISDEEAKICADNGVDYVEFEVANDALTVIVNSENDWATCLTVAELNAIWQPGSKVGNWSQVKNGYPDVDLKLFGPGTDSGTFDYFTGVVNGDEGASRSDYAASEDDNVVVQGVAGERGGLGYLGFSYFDENKDKLKAVEIDGGDGCVAPSGATAQNGTYKPLARPLYAYVKGDSFEKQGVQDFVKYILDNEKQIAEKADFVSLDDEQIARARSDYDAAVAAANS
jgi:phosphate transport system substrate-binding protein